MDRRKHQRLELESLTARLFLSEDHSEIDFAPINISQQGIAIFTGHQLVSGQHLILKLDSQDVGLVVKWCNAKPDDPAIFRVGLETINPQINLAALIQKELSFES